MLLAKHPMSAVTECLVDLAREIRFADLPAEVVREAGRRLLDALGCMVAGADGATTQQVRKTALALAGAPELSILGWAGSTNLAFSIPLACAHLLSLNREETINALGISVTHGGVMDGASHGQMPTSKSLLDGIVAMNAIVAALVAQQGVTGPHEVIEGTAGYVNAVAGACNTDGLLAPVGKHKILETYTKPYNTVKCGQPAVGAALKLAREHRINWSDIASLRIGFARRDANTQARESYARPQSRDTANHSVPYCVAAALIEGQLTADQFNPEILRSPDILGLIDRSSVYWN